MLSNILARRSLVFLMSDEMPENGIVMALVAKKPAVAPTVATAPVAIHSSIHNQQSTISWMPWNGIDGMAWDGRVEQDTSGSTHDSRRNEQGAVRAADRQPSTNCSYWLSGTIHPSAYLAINARLP